MLLQFVTFIAQSPLKQKIDVVDSGTPDSATAKQRPVCLVDAVCTDDTRENTSMLMRL